MSWGHPQHMPLVLRPTSSACPPSALPAPLSPEVCIQKQSQGWHCRSLARRREPTEPRTHIYATLTLCICCTSCATSEQSRHLAVQCGCGEAEIFPDRLRLLITCFPSKAITIGAGTSFLCSAGTENLFKIPPKCLRKVIVFMVLNSITFHYKKISTEVINTT